MSTRTERQSSSNFVPLKFGADAQPREFFWGAELTKDKPESQWNFEEEDEDQDYLQHTLFLRHALVGKGLKDGERNVIEVETKDFAGQVIKLPLVVLTGGKTDMVSLDMNFSHEIPTTFRLVEGNGPIVLNGQQLVEFPNDEINETEYTATETEEETGTEDTEGGEEVVSSPEKSTKGNKRKASVTKASKKKKGKMDSSVDEEEDEEDEAEEDDEEEMETDEEEEEEESEEEKPKKKAGKKAAKVTKTEKSAKVAKKGKKKAK